LHVHEGRAIELTAGQIEVHLYESVYKGNLWCTTLGCQARIVYVHLAGTGGHFRTWKHDDHSDSCMHKFERFAGKVGGWTSQVIDVELSPTKKGKALDEAFELAKRSGMERPAIRSRPKGRSSRTARTNIRTQQTNLVLSDGIDEETIKQRGLRPPRIYKRDARALRQSDIGKVKLVYGFITSVDYGESSALILVDGGNKDVHVRFEEAFFASNPRYAGLFHHAHRLCSEQQNAIFTGIGEVRRGRSDEFELFVYNGEEFKIQNATLLMLAAHYSSGLLDG